MTQQLKKEKKTLLVVYFHPQNREEKERIGL